MLASVDVFFISGEINSQKSVMNDIERSIRTMQNDMTKLNILIHKNKGKQDSLYQGNMLRENEFMDNLKVCSFYVKILTLLMRIAETPGGFT